MKKNIDKKNINFGFDDSHDDSYDPFYQDYFFKHNPKYDELASFDDKFDDEFEDRFDDKLNYSYSASNSNISYLFDNFFFLLKKLDETIAIYDNQFLNNEKKEDIYREDFSKKVQQIQKMIYQVENDLFSSKRFNGNQIVKNFLRHPISNSDNFPVELLYSYQDSIDDNLNNFFMIHEQNPFNQDLLKLLLVILQQVGEFKTPEEHSRFFKKLLISIDRPFEPVLLYILNECPYVIQYVAPYTLNQDYQKILLSNNFIDKYNYSSNSSAFEVSSTISFLFKDINFKTISISDILLYSEANPNTVGTYLSRQLSEEHPLFQKGNEHEFLKAFKSSSAFSTFMKDYHWQYIIDNDLLPKLVNNHHLYLDNAPKFLKEDFEYLLEKQKECSFLFHYININEEQAIKLLAQTQPHFKSKYAYETGMQIFIKSLNNIDFSNKNQEELERIGDYISNIFYRSPDSIFSKDTRVFKYIPNNLVSILLNSEKNIEPYYFLKAAINHHSHTDLEFILKDISSMNNSAISNNENLFFSNMIQQISITFNSSESFDFSYLLKIFQAFPLKKWDDSFNNNEYRSSSNNNTTVSSIIKRCSNTPSNVNDWYSLSAYIEKLNIENDLASIIKNKENIPKSKKIKF